jgi:hypothetical protein
LVEFFDFVDNLFRINGNADVCQHFPCDIFYQLIIFFFGKELLFHHLLLELPAEHFITDVLCCQEHLIHHGHPSHDNHLLFYL